MTVEIFLFGQLIHIEVMLLFQIVLVIVKSSILALNHGLGLSLARGHEVSVSSCLVQRAAVVSSVDDSLPDLADLCLVIDLCAWQRPCLLVVIVELLASS